MRLSLGSAAQGTWPRITFSKYRRLSRVQLGQQILNLAAKLAGA